MHRYNQDHLANQLLPGNGRKSIVSRVRSIAAVALLSFGSASAQQLRTLAPQIDVATIRRSAPGDSSHGMGWEGHRFEASNETISQMMQFAFNLQEKQILGQPTWFDTEKFDIKVQSDAAEATPAEWRLMMQRLLIDR